jgi:hypothetical protein
MKLNPPASSSDLETARGIARRLHRRAKGHERVTDGPPEEAMARPASPPVPPAVPEPAAFEPEPEPESPEPTPEAPPVFETTLPEPTVAEDTPEETEAPPDLEGPAAEIAPPDFPEAGDEAAEVLESLPPEPPADLEGSPEAPPDPWAAQPTPAEGVTAPPVIDPESAFGELGATDDAGPALEGLEPPAEAGSPEDLVGAPATPEWPEGNPLDEQIGTEPEPERAPDDLVSAASPAWEDVADSCLALAGAHAAMLVDPGGQVLTARGAWPEPGPEAIGGRLVSMMEKTLHDAPTRSVSAPLAGQHLTAWRVPSGEGYYTVVFMGDTPLGADVRSPVDVEVKKALGE